MSSKEAKLTEQTVRDILTALNTRQGGLGQIALAHGVAMSVVREVRATRDIVIAEKEAPVTPVEPVDPGEIGGRDE